jgi:hypothetical protein
VRKFHERGLKMTKFEDLADNVRVLLLTKLRFELLRAGCDNLPRLARRRQQDVATVWRDICRKAGQRNCTIPVELLYDPRI